MPEFIQHTTFSLTDVITRPSAGENIYSLTKTKKNKNKIGIRCIKTIKTLYAVSIMTCAVANN